MRLLQLFVLLVGSLLWQSLSAALHNQLKDNPSPYLALHGNDPVAWQTWSQETLDIARRENKLLFVSVGYFSCHWCHVMQRESFSDTGIAKLLNTHFIPVKVDRELNPALDAYLIEFLQRTRGQAGWPLNIFVTPEGNPVVGAVYLPRDRLRTLLRDINELWQNNNAALRDMAAQAAAQLKGKPLKSRSLVPGMGERYLAAFVQQAMDNADEMVGGFGEQSKFPMIDQLRVLLKVYSQPAQSTPPTPPTQLKALPQLGQFLQTTLDHMATQGLRDQIGGGFFRYTVDPNWQTPHYEKMLYDNAGLAQLYLEAARVFQRDDYRAVGRETLDFMIRELMTPDGGMVSSLSAVDANNVEGGYYLWDKSTLHKLLSPPEYDVLALLWGLDRPAENEAGYLPKQLMAPDAVAQQLGQSVNKVMGLIAKAQGKLFQARHQRKQPVDTKQLAAWNGLALSAMARGAQLDRGEKYRDAARRLRNYLVNRLWNGRRLARAVDRQGSLGQGGLEDYAYAAQGVYDWAMISGEKKDLDLVRQWLAYAWQHFYSPSGWRRSDVMLIKQDLGAAVLDDGPLPSPSSILLKLSWHMAMLTHDEKLQRKVITALGLGHELLEQQPFYYANQVALMAEVQEQNAFAREDKKKIN